MREQQVPVTGNGKAWDYQRKHTQRECEERGIPLPLWPEEIKSLRAIASTGDSPVATLLSYLPILTRDPDPRDYRIIDRNILRDGWQSAIGALDPTLAYAILSSRGEEDEHSMFLICSYQRIPDQPFEEHARPVTRKPKRKQRHAEGLCWPADPGTSTPPHGDALAPRLRKEADRK